jgi:division protein CdvB (Snf7/Vps24/ESCRT-III family)
MHFQLLKLIIWPKNKAFAPRVIKFEPAKVNVITGGSRTGKSAIIPIIDYCLASSECHIPIDTIRDNSDWYGVVVETGHEQLLIARKKPDGRSPSDDFYLARGLVVTVPPFLNTPNQKQDSVKHLLNSLSGVPYFKSNGDDDSRPYQERLSFRDLMALVFQSQEVVANQNIIFYKTHAHEHRERLKNWLPYILEAEKIDVLEARQRLSIVQSRLNQLRKEAAKAGRVSSAWLSNMTGHLQVAKSYGMLGEEYALPTDPLELLETAKYIVASPLGLQPTLLQIDQASKDLLLLEQEDERLSDEISLFRKRLSDLASLKAGLIGYGNSAKRRADRLHVSQWLENIAAEGHECPLCGGEEHDKAHIELRKISAAFKEVEDSANKTSEVPSSFVREEATLRNQLEGALTRKKNWSTRLDVALSQNKSARERFDRRQSMSFFLGHLKASLETFESLTEEGAFGEKITLLEKEEKDLLLILDPGGVARRLGMALKDISQRALVRLQTLDVEDKYKRIPPEFSVKDLNLKVLSNDGHWHFLAEVGSASNWLSFHIAFICALHEFFNDCQASSVPSFAVFDQPSQVYFPRIMRAELNAEVDKSQYADEDVEAVIGIFKTLADSVRSQNGKWQCIVLDHARDEIYRDIDEVHEVEVWRNGEKLIPLEWYE